MTWHTRLSYIKSAIRVIGFVALGINHLLAAGLFLIAAELVGVFEELPSMYKGTKIS